MGAAAGRTTGSSKPLGVLPVRMDCAETACDREAEMRLYVPWTTDRSVCVAHARVAVQRDGVVAEPLEDAELL